MFALKSSVRCRHLECLYKSFILPHLEYGGIIFDSANRSLLAKLDQVHYRAALLVSGCITGTNSQKVLKCLDWTTLECRRNEKKVILIYDVIHNNAPSYVQDVFNVYRCTHVQRLVRNQRVFAILVNTSSKLRKLTVCSSIVSWENLL
jgi:hypothetical protein